MSLFKNLFATQVSPHIGVTRCLLIKSANSPSLFANSSNVPISTIFPSSMTIILSQLRIVERRCATMICVECILSRLSVTIVYVRLSNALVASSNTTIAGLAAMARAIKILCR